MKKILLKIGSRFPLIFLIFLSLTVFGNSSFARTSIQNITEQGNETRVFPNPFKNSFTIDNRKGYSEALLLDVTGKVIFKIPLQDKLTWVNDNQFEMSKLPEGIYFLTLAGGNNDSTTLRLIKSNR
jgi:hypothetical protein